MSAADSPGVLRRWLIIVTVMTATSMQVLDTTIANVALPHMQAALGGTPETIVWVLTSYLIMTAIVTPITGWLEGLTGRRNLLAIAIGGFTLSSAACGLATSLEMIVAARAAQGAFGALILPLSQATIMDTSTPEEYGSALMIFTMGLTAGPALGPVLGGWLTDSYDWRWVFFINVPIGMLCMFGIFTLIERKEPARRPLDAWGFVFLAVGLIALQLLLDRGTQLDWFDSPEIVIESLLAVAAFWMFGIHIFYAREPILPTRLLKDRNYMIALMFGMTTMGIVVAGPALLAPMLQQLMGYDTIGAGMLMAPRGIGALISLPLATWLVRMLDGRLVVAIGLVIIICSLWVCTRFSPIMSGELIVYSSFFQGIGLALVSLPTTLLAFSHLDPKLRTEAAAFFSLSRSVGSAIMLSIVSALLARNVQVNHLELTERVNLPAYSDASIIAIDLRPLGLLDAEVNRQAMMIAYLDNFWLMMWITLLIAPFVLILRKGGANKVDLAVE